MQVSAAYGDVGSMESGSLRQFHESVADCFLPLRISNRGSAMGAFPYRFETCEIGPLRFTDTWTFPPAPIIAERERSDICDGACDRFVLLITHSGLTRHSQFSRTHETYPGHMALFSYNAPYRAEQTIDSHSLHVSIPGYLLRAVVQAPEDYCSLPINTHEGLGAVFLEFLLSVWSHKDELQRSQIEAISRQCVNMLALVMDTSSDSDQVRTFRSASELHMERALRYIEDSLCNPDLGPKVVANALRISESHLYALAHDQGVSIARTIMNLRLEKCCEMLVSPMHVHRRIIEIAFDWGFRDVSHFSKVFRSKYGVPPRVFRKLGDRSSAGDAGI